MNFRKELTQRQKEIIYELACDWQHDSYSSLEPFEYSLLPSGIE